MGELFRDRIKLVSAGWIMVLLLSPLYLEADITDAKRKDVHVVLREQERELTLTPGELTTLSSSCEDDEAVVSGGPTNIPGAVLEGRWTIAYSTLFVGATLSGWTVAFRNDSSETALSN
jgi:hypothetical protein